MTQSPEAALAVDIGSTMPDPFFKTGEDIRGLNAPEHPGNG